MPDSEEILNALDMADDLVVDLRDNPPLQKKAKHLRDMAYMLLRASNQWAAADRCPLCHRPLTAINRANP